MQINKMKKILFSFTIILVFMLMFFQCKKECNSEKLGDRKFTQTDRNIVPYNGLENLIFKDSIGDTVSMHPEVSTGRMYSYDNKFYEYYFSSEKCPPNYYYVEQNYTHFVGKDYGTSIWTDIYFDNPFADTLKKYIVIKVAFEDSQSWYFTRSFFFNSSTLFNRYPQESKIIDYNDSLKIGPKWFLKVYTLKQIQDPYGLKNLQFVYYSLNDGVVGFKTKDGHLLYLFIKN